MQNRTDFGISPQLFASAKMLCWTAFLSLRSGFSLVQFVSHPPTPDFWVCVYRYIIVLVFLIGHVAVAVTTAFLF